MSQCPVIHSFKYLRRVLAEEDDDWTEVVGKLRRAIQKWAQLTWILSREGVDERTLGNIYLEVVKSVLMYR